MTKNMRDYGLGATDQYTDGAPRLLRVLAEPMEGVAPVCPNCACKSLCEIEVTIKGHPLVRGGNGLGRYLSCPACPWASPMMIHSTCSQAK